jgi:hypothetical protein
VGTHSDIKADKAAIIVGNIYHPHLSMGFSNGQVGLLLRKSRGILNVLRKSLLGSFPQGRREIWQGGGYKHLLKASIAMFLKICESRNLLDTNASFCIGCRRSSRFNEERP